MDYLRQLVFSFETQTLLLLGLAAAAGVAGHYAVAAVKNKLPRQTIVMSICVFIVAVSASIQSIIKMYHTLTGVPAILISRPTSITKLRADSPDIHFIFTAPVKFKTLAVHTNPPIELTVKKRGYLWNLIPFGTSLTLSPKTTLPPNESLMIYLANMEGPATRGFGGEQLLELVVDDPVVTTTEPTDKSDQVATTQEFIITLASPIARDEEWSVQSEPKHPLTLKKTKNDTFSVVPDEPFKQGASYRIMLFHTPKILDRKSKEVIQQLDARIKSEIAFSVVKAAFISSFSPNGDTANPNDPIVVTFDQAMDYDTLMDHITIDPTLEFTDSWDEGTNTLTLRHNNLEKDKQYTIKLEKGLQTKAGGKLEADASFTFHTAGPLSVKESLPKHDEKNMQVNTPIRITFNQNIPKNITDHIHISPEIEGDFTVTDNMVEFVPKENLPFDTDYTIKIDNGTPSVYGLPTNTEIAISFRTSSEQIQLAIPFLRQQTQFTCNISALRMMLAYRNISVSEKDLIHITGLGGKRGSGNPHVGYVDDFGTFWEPIHKAASTHRNARLITSGNLTDILSEVRKGNPVMTWGQNGWSDPHDISWTASDGTFIKAVNGMHSMVVRGYSGSIENPKQIFVNDPWRGQYSMSPAEFMRRWRFYSMAMVLE